MKKKTLGKHINSDQTINHVRNHIIISTYAAKYVIISNIQNSEKSLHDSINHSLNIISINNNNKKTHVKKMNQIRLKLHSDRKSLAVIDNQ